MSGSPVVSSQASRPGSADDTLATVNPGYVPDPDEDDTPSQLGADNQTFIDNGKAYINFVLCYFDCVSLFP